MLFGLVPFFNLYRRVNYCQYLELGEDLSPIFPPLFVPDGVIAEMRKHYDVDWNKQLLFWQRKSEEEKSGKVGGKVPLPIHEPRPKQSENGESIYGVYSQKWATQEKEKSASMKRSGASRNDFQKMADGLFF
jgi:hypothetical protein